MGIEKEIFRDCVYIKQQNIDTIENPGALADRLQSIATTSTEELSLQTALDKLENALDQVGTERRKTSPLGQCSATITQLKNELADVGKKHDQLTLSINELDALTQQRSCPLNEQQQFQYLIACVEAKEIETRLENIRDYNENIDQIEQELEILQAYQDFPVDRRDELLISQTQLSENKRRKEKLEAELFDNEKDHLELQGQLQSLSGCEQIGERLEEIRRLESRHKLLIEEEIKDSTALADIPEDFTMQSNRLNYDESRFNSMDNDQFTQILQDESNLQQNQENLNLRQREITRESERLDNLNHRRQSQKKQSKFLIFSGVVAWIAAAVILTLSVALSVVIFSVGLLSGFFSIQKRKQVKTLESQIGKLSADIENIKDIFPK